MIVSGILLIFRTMFTRKRQSVTPQMTLFLGCYGYTHTIPPVWHPCSYISQNYHPSYQPSIPKFTFKPSFSSSAKGTIKKPSSPIKISSLLRRGFKLACVHISGPKPVSCRLGFADYADSYKEKARGREQSCMRLYKGSGAPRGQMLST